MASMGSVRTSARWLRLALAMLFAVITVVQAPTLALAWATKSSESVTLAPSASHRHAHSDHHRHHADVAIDDLDADVTYGDPLCQAMGCCWVAVNPAVVRSPAVVDLVLGLIDQAPARVMLPAFPEPADPPPRIQV